MIDGLYTIDGRINRKIFAIRTGLYVLVAGILYFAFERVFKLLKVRTQLLLNEDMLDSPWSLFLLALLILTIVWFMQIMKRLQDLNLSGWFGILVVGCLFIPFGNILFALAILFLLLMPGTKGDNTFGKQME